MSTELPWICLIGALPIVGLIVLATVVKLTEVRRSQHWQETTATIVRSKVVARKERSTDEQSSFRNYPQIAYEYMVEGKRYRGTRLSLAEKPDNTDIEGTLARYPIGRTVPVYYNPANPTEAILERQLPPKFGWSIGGLVLFLVVVAIAAPLVVNGLSDWLAPLLPDPERAVMVVILAGLALFAALLALVFHRQVWASQSWHTADGRILVADIEAYRTWVSSSDASPSGWRTRFRPSIVYTFEVNGQQYVSDRVSFGGQIGWSAASFVSGRVAKYPVDSPVTVYYNPQNPAESVLERRASGIIVLWIVAAILVVGAVALSGLI